LPASGTPMPSPFLADFAISLDQINQAQELDPSSPAILADKGILLCKAGKKEEDIEVLKEVERSYPDFRSPHQYLMLISFSLRDYPIYLTEGAKAAQAVNDVVLSDSVALAREGFSKDGERGLLRNLYGAQKNTMRRGKFPASCSLKLRPASGWERKMKRCNGWKRIPSP